MLAVVAVVATVAGLVLYGASYAPPGTMTSISLLVMAAYACWGLAVVAGLAAVVARAARASR